MLGSTVLEVAIGLGFCYASLALIVSTLQEALAALFRQRATLLHATVKRMLGDQHALALAGALYTHPLIIAGGVHEPRTAWPSYIAPANFALALRDCLRGSDTSLAHDIAAVREPHLRRTLQMLLEQSGGTEAGFQQALAAWFEQSMTRLSGLYKRRQLLISFLLALLLAIMFNIDSIHLLRTLWQHPALAAHITAAPTGIDPHLLAQLRVLPIGWEQFPPRFDSRFALQVAGWLFTASTTLFGAPFWFDLLQRLINMRSTGAKPASAGTDGASAQPPQPGAALRS